MDVINEGSTFRINISFLDPDGVQQAPTAAQYQVHDQDTGMELITSTLIVPAGSVDVLIPPAASRVVSPSVVHEVHVITVSAQYGSTEAVNEEFLFDVRNLRFVTT